MNGNSNEIEMNKEKRGLLLTMIQRKFENHVYDYLNKADFADMDSLDRWLDKAISNYFDECKVVEEYYKMEE